MEDINKIGLDDQQLNAVIYMFNLQDKRDVYEENLYQRFMRIKALRVEHHSALSIKLDSEIKLRQA